MQCHHAGGCHAELASTCPAARQHWTRTLLLTSFICCEAPQQRQQRAILHAMLQSLLRLQMRLHTNESVKSADLLTTPDPLQSSSSIMCSTSLLVGSKPSSVKNPLISAGVNTPLPPWSTCHIRAIPRSLSVTNLLQPVKREKVVPGACLGALHMAMSFCENYHLCCIL